MGLETIKRTKKGLSVSRAKEKNLINKAPYLIECNFKSDAFGQKMSSDVSYIKCSDGTLYLSAVKDYFNNEIVSYSTSNNNDVNLILESYNVGLSNICHTFLIQLILRYLLCYY